MKYVFEYPVFSTLILDKITANVDNISDINIIIWSKQ